MSNSIDKITSIFEDISIKHEEPSDGGFKLVSKSETSLSPIDDKTIRLLELIDSYEKLTNENRLNYINGFLNLSRANYNNGSLSKKYGADSFDLRPYGACKKIKVSDKFELEDLLKEQKTKNEQPKTNNINKEDDAESTLKNRKTKKTETDIESDDINDIESQEPKLKDPISQFGGLVPYQLRQSQTFFGNSLAISIKIINLQRAIKELIEDIEEISK
ncbi:unnamed protein product [Debaryomyces tyrocola]|nr:unnamed protein product [Debaryomyces tyrocola]